MGLDKDHTFNNTELACFVTGVAAILMGYSVYSHLKSVQDNHSQTKKLSNKPETKIEDAIQLKSLAYLMQSPNANIQSCASKVILERAMSRKSNDDNRNSRRLTQTDFLKLLS
ncbi:hypothetical protein BY458DRAFT_439377 [Sporodiniella umbellata]|nr:hypothetical protein BY458DRAFT_439377 [Sporodiniella umbellata]